MTKIKINENMTIELTLPEVMTIEEFEKVASAVMNTVEEEETETANIGSLLNALSHTMALRHKLQNEMSEKKTEENTATEPSKSNTKKIGAQKKYSASDIAFIKKAKKDGHKANEIVKMFNKRNPKKQINKGLYYYIISRNK